MTDAAPRADIYYATYQAEFFHRFVAEIKPGCVHILLGPAGSGKSTVMAGIISELARTGRVLRALVLAPAALTDEWACLLRRGGPNPVVVDDRVLRLLREQLGRTPNDWPNGVYSMSIDLAKRPDVCALLVAVGWDLVVVDEAQTLTGQRLQSVVALVGRENPPPLLLAARVLNEGTRAFVERATLTDWSKEAAELRSRQEDGANPQVVRVTRIYQRSIEEAAIATEVVDNARQLGQLEGMVLLQRAASSVSSLEDTLVRWVEEPKERIDHIEGLTKLLQRVEQLRVDSRLTSFQGLVEELVRAGARHVVTFCEYRATLDYVAAAVERLDFADFGLHGAMTDERRQEAVSRFEAEGGLLITTSAAAKGLEFSCDAAIHYDLPMSPAVFYVREARYRMSERNLPCAVYFFEDETGALPLEDVLLRMVRKLDLLKGDMDIDIGAVFRAMVK